MKIKNEREILPFARSPRLIVNYDENFELLSLFDKFIQSDMNEDSYNGWALDIHFTKQGSDIYQRYVDFIDISKCENIGDEWTFYSSHNKDDNVLVYHKNEISALIVFHLHSFLWNYPTPEELGDKE